VSRQETGAEAAVSQREHASASAPDIAERKPMFSHRPLVNLRVDIEQFPYQLFLNGGLVTSHRKHRWNVTATTIQTYPANVIKRWDGAISRSVGLARVAGAGLGDEDDVERII
jgi:hypothetical protein